MRQKNIASSSVQARYVVLYVLLKSEMGSLGTLFQN